MEEKWVVGVKRVKVESEDGPTAIIMEGARPLATCYKPTGASRLEGAFNFLGKKDAKILGAAPTTRRLINTILQS
jgi:hypothetical protein